MATHGRGDDAYGACGGLISDANGDDEIEQRTSTAEGEQRDVAEGSECGITVTGESSASKATSTSTADRQARRDRGLGMGLASSTTRGTQRSPGGVDDGRHQSARCGGHGRPSRGAARAMSMGEGAPGTGTVERGEMGAQARELHDEVAAGKDGAHTRPEKSSGRRKPRWDWAPWGRAERGAVQKRRTSSSG
jgi:hypothetical protein